MVNKKVFPTSMFSKSPKLTGRGLGLKRYSGQYKLRVKSFYEKKVFTYIAKLSSSRMSTKGRFPKSNVLIV